MAYNNLRALMKRLAPPREITLKNCNVVIDGKTFFKNTYKDSGCYSLLGGEYDRYADSLRILLKPFVESNITCFVIFNGCMDADLEKRTEIHQKISDKIDAIDFEDYNAYCEPILVKDVVKEILTELGIKYYVTKNDHRRVMLSVGSFFNCPIITNNYEYSLLYNSCISPKSLSHDVDNNQLTCKMFDKSVSSKNFGIKNCLLPLLFTLLHEKGAWFKKLTLIVNTPKPKHLLSRVLTWTRMQVYNLENAFEMIKEILTSDEWTEFMTTYEANIELCTRKSHLRVVKHFSKPIDEDIRHNGYLPFKKAIETGRMAVSYINLSEKGTFSGSWVIFDKEEEDAMMPALDIVFYVKRFLDNERESKITFIGRQEYKSCAWEISRTWKDWSPKNNHDIFVNFLYEFLPGFDMKLLEPAPKECWILIVTLLYYCQKKMDMNFVYCVLLSYVMLGPVSNKVGVIKRSYFMFRDKVETEEGNADRDGLKIEDCNAVVESMMDLFYVKNRKTVNRKLLQTLAEFQHCLQHMNYMNKLFGCNVEATVYHKTINATFVYNMYIELEGTSCAVKYLEKCLKGSTVFTSFKRIEHVFATCMASSGQGTDERMRNLQIDK